jgi:hypothetical protein
LIVDDVEKDIRPSKGNGHGGCRSKSEVVAVDENGNEVSRYRSQNDAAYKTHRHQQTICKAISKGKKLDGLYWKLEEKHVDK